MSYCPKCGREILDETKGCPNCTSHTNDETSTERVEQFTVEDKNGTYQKFENNQTYGTWGTQPIEEKTVPTILKVITIVAVILIGGIGAIAGLIAGLSLMKSPFEDYRKFGKTLVIVSTVMLALSLLCCLIGVLGNIVALPFVVVEHGVIENGIHHF